MEYTLGQQILVIGRIIIWLHLLITYHPGDTKKAKIHYEAAAMAGNEVARNTLGCICIEFDLAPHVADMCICRQILADIACRCDTEEAPTYPIYINYYRQVQISPNIQVP